MASETTPPGQPEAVILAMPAAESWTPEQIAWFQERLKAAMANPGPLRVLPSEHWKGRAEAAEAKLARVRELAGQLVTATHPTIGGTFAASIGHKFLAITGTEEGEAEAQGDWLTQEFLAAKREYEALPEIARPVVVRSRGTDEEPRDGD